MKSKKSFKWFIICMLVILLIILSYFGYKFYLINKYDVSELNDYPNLSNEEIIVTSKSFSETTDYESYKKIDFIIDNNFLICNDEQLTAYGRASVYVLDYKSNDNYEASISISSLPDLYNAFITEGEVETFNYSLNEIDVSKLYKEHNISNTKDLYNAWFKDYNKDINILTSSSDIKYNYFITNTSLATKHKADTIKGDIEGYLYTINNNIYQATIFIGNEPYEIVFMNKNKEYFNKTNVIEFLSNIRINN